MEDDSDSEDSMDTLVFPDARRGHWQQRAPHEPPDHVAKVDSWLRAQEADKNGNRTAPQPGFVSLFAVPAGTDHRRPMATERLQPDLPGDRSAAGPVPEPEPEPEPESSKSSSRHEQAKPSRAEHTTGMERHTKGEKSAVRQSSRTKSVLGSSTGPFEPELPSAHSEISVQALAVPPRAADGSLSRRDDLSKHELMKASSVPPLEKAGKFPMEKVGMPLAEKAGMPPAEKSGPVQHSVMDGEQPIPGPVTASVKSASSCGLRPAVDEEWESADSFSDTPDESQARFDELLEGINRDIHEGKFADLKELPTARVAAKEKAIDYGERPPGIDARVWQPPGAVPEGRRTLLWGLEGAPDSYSAEQLPKDVPDADNEGAHGAVGEAALEGGSAAEVACAAPLTMTAGDVAAQLTTTRWLPNVDASPGDGMTASSGATDPYLE
ncbi:uncharacterized protein LOC119110152 [Pollicipes pollicipes]|uniref:uncharacterized protein LOC119110152 n=1 Tax=Pollicipes pollicipes TaxID=41117 RepID=UPI0018858FC3|nr:uncharacterized protein LOC119110152 [Pollicipes pollicipes]